MADIFTRTRSLLGDSAVTNLGGRHVAVFGIGGVGGYACEALVRSGIGEFTLVDFDVVDVTNINRQIIALQDTVGRPKTEVMEDRMHAINPSAIVNTRTCRFLPDNADRFDFATYDYVVDAVDNVTAKLEIISRAKAAGVPVISAMGAGNKLDAGRFMVSDIEKTRVCPLARVMRRELKKRGLSDVKVVWSDEPPHTETPQDDNPTGGRPVPASIAYAPAIAGLMMAAEVIRDLTALPETL